MPNCGELKYWLGFYSHFTLCIVYRLMYYDTFGILTRVSTRQEIWDIVQTYPIPEIAFFTSSLRCEDILTPKKVFIVFKLRFFPKQVKVRTHSVLLSHFPITHRNLHN